MGFNFLRPPISETIFNKEGVINEVWNKFYNSLIGIEEFRELEAIVANHVLIGYDIASTDYVAATSGWRIASDAGVGVAEFNIPIVAYGDVTGTKPPTNADNTQSELNLGAALDDAKANGVTLVSGGYIRTSLLHTDVLLIGEADLTADNTANNAANYTGNSISTFYTNATQNQSDATTNAAIAVAETKANFSTISDTGGTLTITSSKLIINAANGLEITGNGSIKIIDTNSKYTQLKAAWDYKAYEGASVHDMKIESNYATSQLTFKNYKYIGSLGGNFSIGGNITTNARLNLTASTSYDSFTYSAVVHGDAIFYDEVDIQDTLTVDAIISDTGIKPSVSSDLLDYYEEGTYTADLVPLTGSITLSAAGNELAYTRVGNQVTVTGRLSVSSVSSPSSILYVDLPFAVFAATDQAEFFTGAILRDGINTSTTAPWMLYGYTGSAAAIYELTTTGKDTTIADRIKAGSTLLFSFSYFTT